MAERKQIPKSVRFEVLKRDKFTCQYCGREAPDVILEIDHIIPVSKGGDNSIMNLVTSCRDCNRGKSDKELSDDAAIKKQKQQLDDMQDRRDQMEMMVEWRKELFKQSEAEVEMISDIFHAYTDYTPRQSARLEIKNLIRRFGIDEVCIATEISIAKYFDGGIMSLDYVVSKIGGVCYNRKRKREEDAEQDN